MASVKQANKAVKKAVKSAKPNHEVGSVRSLPLADVIERRRAVLLRLADS